MIVISFILTILTVYIAICIVYITIYSISGLFYTEVSNSNAGELPKAAVFIPAYKEDSVIIDSVNHALSHQYQGIFEIIVIADSLEESTIAALKALPIIVIEVKFKKSTKAKALNYALNKIDSSFQMAVVLDADNHMSNNFLDIMGGYINQDYDAIQGHRKAKNLNSQVAILDAISEEVNNHIYSKGPNTINLSSRLAGSGMAFGYSIFKKLMKQIDAVGGFDKELEMALIENNVFIKYSNNAIILDEKVANKDVYRNQRARWISAQFNFLKQLFPKILSNALINYDYSLKGIQLALPPRLFIPIIPLLLALISIILDNMKLTAINTMLLVLICIGYYIAIPKEFRGISLLKLLSKLFELTLTTVSTLFKINKANKAFIHTPHTVSNQD